MHVFWAIHSTKKTKVLWFSEKHLCFLKVHIHNQKWKPWFSEESTGFLREICVFWEKNQVFWEKTDFLRENQDFWEKPGFLREKTGFLRANQVFQEKTRFSESKPGFLRKNKISERKPALLRENLIFYGVFFHGIEYDVLLHRIFLSKHGVLALKRWNSMKPRFWVQNLCFHATWKFKSETESDMD